MAIKKNEGGILMLSVFAVLGAVFLVLMGVIIRFYDAFCFTMGGKV